MLYQCKSNRIAQLTVVPNIKSNILQTHRDILKTSDVHLVKFGTYTVSDNSLVAAIKADVAQ